MRTLAFYNSLVFQKPLVSLLSASASPEAALPGLRGQQAVPGSIETSAVSVPTSQAFVRQKLSWSFLVRTPTLCRRVGALGSESGGSEAAMADHSRDLVFRHVEAGDYHKGYLDLLGQLTVVGPVTEAAFQARAAEISARAPDYRIIVVEDVSAGKIVATGTLLVERKFLRNCGLVGHIEDIVVDSSRRGLHLGKRVINELARAAEELGCYKVILDCSESNVAFYEKCQFKRKEVQMARYFEK